MFNVLVWITVSYCGPCLACWLGSSGVAIVVLQADWIMFYFSSGLLSGKNVQKKIVVFPFFSRMERLL